MKLTLIYDTHMAREKGGFDGIVKFEWDICKNYISSVFVFVFVFANIVWLRQGLAFHVKC